MLIDCHIFFVLGGMDIGPNNALRKPAINLEYAAHIHEIEGNHI